MTITARDNHTVQPLAALGAFIAMIGFFAAPFAVTALAFGESTSALIAAAIAVVGLVTGGALITKTTRALHHLALVPDVTDDEAAAYRRLHPHPVA
ncbi:hypothetical protein GII30_13730 [Gordonia amarae]|uniref:Uncharacterized protein n=2 Tax=Gordonia amarae TaxID=36821 RepID=G7GSN8_9ACTN|nr:hypothetical protein [Gordonia amarae]MCS3879458.1 hypothetical protein [Gordonia amarae]QHN17923.1 hypothetical protein GII35_13985 [Gordonia amarae]QHN22445.1 hypothetical protein GII34_13735 [Gordonia amarae]QHN31321.1 hypothetical protein GII32_13895 [Gordonia amarae]QHN40066.1 hypothetical protein GII30_13730 [Gordonia amarae]